MDLHFILKICSRSVIIHSLLDYKNDFAYQLLLCECHNIPFCTFCSKSECSTLPHTFILPNCNTYRNCNCNIDRNTEGVRGEHCWFRLYACSTGNRRAGLMLFERESWFQLSLSHSLLLKSHAVSTICQLQCIQVRALYPGFFWMAVNGIST